MKPTSFRKFFSLVVLCSLLSWQTALAADLTINGVAPKPQSLSVDELKHACAASIQSVDFNNRSGKHKAKAVPLTAALELAGIDLNLKPSPDVAPAAKHPSLRMAALVRGSDGYAVIFSLAELLPAVGNRPAWIAFDQDDQPFPANEGPLKLLVPTDAGPARSVRGVTEIQIINLAGPTTQAMEK